MVPITVTTAPRGVYTREKRQPAPAPQTRPAAAEEVEDVSPEIVLITLPATAALTARDQPPIPEWLITVHATTNAQDKLIIQKENVITHVPALLVQVHAPVLLSPKKTSAETPAMDVKIVRHMKSTIEIVE